MKSLRSQLGYVGSTSVEVARQMVDLPRPCGVTELGMRCLPPSTLQFRLKNFVEHQSTDDTLQGASDEVFISAVGTASTAVKVGTDQAPVFDPVRGPTVGDVSEDGVRERWSRDPCILMQFDLHQPADWPRSYTVTLLIVEEDNGTLRDSFDSLHKEYGKAVKTAVTTAVARAAGSLAGAAVGSIIPGIGTVVGAAVGALVGDALDNLIEEIKRGLANEVFRPVPITLVLLSPWLARTHPSANCDLTETIREHGADYDVIYEWHTIG